MLTVIISVMLSLNNVPTYRPYLTCLHLYTVPQSRCEDNNGIRDGTLMGVLYDKHQGRCRRISSLPGKRRDVVLDDLLDFSLHLGGNVTSRDLLQERALSSSQM